MPKVIRERDRQDLNRVLPSFSPHTSRVLRYFSRYLMFLLRVLQSKNVVIGL